MSLEKSKDKDKKKQACKVLLASQSQAYRNNLASTMRMQGYDVEFAHGGFHLLHLLENEIDNNFNIIILHENLEDMSAYEVISLVRLNKTKTELPVIFISRDSQEVVISEMLSVEANDYIIQTPAYGPVINAAKKYC